eukprot:3618518-Pleurochrysis_carterae.AAC.1
MATPSICARLRRLCGAVGNDRRRPKFLKWAQVQGIYCLAFHQFVLYELRGPNLSAHAVRCDGRQRGGQPSGRPDQPNF